MTRSPLVSLSALMNDAPAEPAGEAAPQGPVAEDDRSEEKLTARRDELLAAIREMRPRFAAAFERMAFAGSTIRIAVPTSELREEILRSQTELLIRLVEVAGVQGALQLEIAVDEQVRASTPIRIEDRLAWLSERNTALQALRKALDLEIEG